MADITIYTRGTKQDGLGHVVRQRLLAKLLVERGASVEFITPCGTPGWEWLANDKRWTVTNNYSGHGRVGIVDVEHGPSAELLKLMCASFDSVVTVYGGHSFALTAPDAVESLSDLVLCQSLFEFDRPAHVLQGTQYLILDPAYAKCVPDRAGPVICCMGGADPHHLSGPTLHALRDIGRPVIAIMGNAAELPVGQLPANATIVRGAAGIAEYLNGAALLVGALGMVAYEALAGGTPVALYSWSENHKATADELARRGVATSLGLWSDFDAVELQRAVDRSLGGLDESAYFWQQASARARQLVDGQGARRCADAVMGLMR